MGDCNTNTTKGCTDDQSYSKLVVTQPKILAKLEDIEISLFNFSQALALYCETEEQNLVLIKNRVTNVVNINNECCNTVNLKLQELLTVIEGISICGETTTTSIITTTEEVTTSIEATTTPEPTTTL